MKQYLLTIITTGIIALKKNGFLDQSDVVEITSLIHERIKKKSSNS